VAFHDAFSRLALARGWLRLFTLRVGEAPVAVLYCLRYGTTMHYFQSGFDDAWTRRSVGLVAMGLAIKASFEEGADEYDLLHGDEPYKFQWADRTHILERLELYPAHAFGAFCRRAMAVKRAMRRALLSARSLRPFPHVESPS
jgi:CelD/BcsL family acetyltransferase involved in cellulose biosynthesis